MVILYTFFRDELTTQCASALYTTVFVQHYFCRGYSPKFKCLFPSVLPLCLNVAIQSTQPRLNSRAVTADGSRLTEVRFQPVFRPVSIRSGRIASLSILTRKRLDQIQATDPIEIHACLFGLTTVSAQYG